VALIAQLLSSTICISRFKRSLPVDLTTILLNSPTDLTIPIISLKEAQQLNRRRKKNILR
jgi:hypothetical protein